MHKCKWQQWADNKKKNSNLPALQLIVLCINALFSHGNMQKKQSISGQRNTTCACMEVDGTHGLRR